MNLTKEKLIALIKEEVGSIKEYVGNAVKTSNEMKEAVMAIVQNAKMEGRHLMIWYKTYVEWNLLNMIRT